MLACLKIVHVCRIHHGENVIVILRFVSLRALIYTALLTADLAAAEGWYTELLGRGGLPTARHCGELADSVPLFLLVFPFPDSPLWRAKSRLTVVFADPERFGDRRLLTFGCSS
jgi:hypothetical protein